MNSLKLIPRYDGTGDVEAWLCKAELVVQARKEELTEVIPVCLDGAAFAVYEHMTAADRMSYARIRAELTQAFGMSPYTAFAAFCERRIHAEESAEVYAIAITRLGRLCGITDDVALACKFVNGLPLNVRKEVMLKMGRVPRLTDVTEAAQLLLSNARNSMSGFAGWAHRSSSSKNNEKNNRCFKCGNNNHLAGQCRVWTCFRCGQEGHIARACPTRASENFQGKVASSPPQGNLPGMQQ